MTMEADQVETVATPTFDNSAHSPKILDFLKSMHPNGPWTITQIATGGGLQFSTFTERDQAAMMRWLADRNGKTNLYFNVNPSVTINHKSSLHHVTSVPRLHVDLDPRKNKNIAEERKLILGLIQDEALLKQAGLPGLPSCLIDSGRGFWAFWELVVAAPIEGQEEGPRREAAVEIGRYNRWIAEQLNFAINALDGDKSPENRDVADACHNIDRIARLPYTTNFPSADKIAAGATISLASVVGQWPHSYKLEQFQKSDTISYGAGATEAELAAIDVGTIVRTLPGNYEPADIADEIRRLYPQVGDKCLELVVLGRYLDPEAGADNIDDKVDNSGELHTNRSRAHWRVNRHMQQVGVPLNVVLGILCDERLPISDYGRKPYNDKKKRWERERNDQETIGFNKIQVKKAAASIAKQRAREAEFEAQFSGAQATTGAAKGKGDGSVPTTVEQVVAHLNRDHAVLLQEGGKTRVLSWERSEIDYSREIPVLQTFDDFRNRYMHRVVSVGIDGKGQPILKPWGEVWLKHIRRKEYLSLRFLPGQPEEVDGYLNMWRGFAVEPAAGDWSLMEQHIRGPLSGNDVEVAEYILNWSAWTVQHPDEPAEVAMVFKGKKGTGKGVFARAIKRLFGQHGLQITSPAQLTGRFNSHLRDCCLLFADEAIVPEDKKAESVLKGLITEPELAVEGKGANVIQARNRLHIIMASNEDWVIPAGIDERRFAVFEVGEDYRQNEVYFKALTEQLNEGGLAAMLFALLNRDVSGWHPRRSVPQTEALRAQKESSLKPFEAFMINMLEEGVLPCDSLPGHARCVPSRDTHRRLGLFTQIRNSTPDLKNYSDKRLGSELKKWGCRRHSNGNKRGWEFPELNAMRKAFDERYWKNRWDEQQEWPEVMDNTITDLDDYRAMNAF